MALRLFSDWQEGTTNAFVTIHSGFALNAFNIQIYAFIIPTLLGYWGLSHSQAGALASAALFSSAFGGWFAGVLADRFGRIFVLKISILWFAIATCLCGISSSYEQLFIARVIQGLGFGAEIAIGTVFIGEVASAKCRSRTVGLAQSGWAIGWALAAVMSLTVTTMLPMETAWRVLFFIGVIPACFIFFYRHKLIASDLFKPGKANISWYSIFNKKICLTTVKGGLLAAGTHTGYWAIATWWPTMLLSEQGLTLIQSGSNLAALISGSFFGYVIGSHLGDKFGRRFTLSCFALSGISLVLLYSLVPTVNMSFAILSFPLGFVATGMYGVIGSILVELYPTELRGSGLGFCYNFGRGVAGMAPAVIGILSASIGVGNAIALYVVIAYGIVLIVAFLLPETRGISLINLQDMPKD